MRGVVLGRCLQTPSQEVPGKRRSCFHLSSHLLLAFFSGIFYSPKRDGNLAGWKDLVVLLHPSASPPSQDFCSVQVAYHAEFAISFLGADVQEAGNHSPLQAMGDVQEDRVTWGQESRARILPNHVGSNQTCRSDKGTGPGKFTLHTFLCWCVKVERETMGV